MHKGRSGKIELSIGALSNGAAILAEPSAFITSSYTNATKGPEFLGHSRPALSLAICYKRIFLALWFSQVK